MNTTHRTARLTAALLAALVALAVATPAAVAARLSRPAQVRSSYFRWYRWHPTARLLHRHYGSKIVIGLQSMQDLKSLRVEYGFQHVQTIPALHAAEVRVNRAQVHALLTRGTHDTRIRYVSPIHTMKPLSVPNDPYLSKIDSTTQLPYEWAFLATHVDTALQYTQGDPHIDVGIIDSGLTYIPDLAGKIDSLWTVNGTKVSQAFNSNDRFGHGTGVGSLIAANVDDGFGMAGFGGATHIIGINAYDWRTRGIPDASAAVALNKLVSLGVRIVNMSFGSQTPSHPILVDAIHRAAAKGVLLIAAAGNASSTVSWPAALLQPAGGGPSYGLAVGATTADGRRAFFSNWGDHLSLMAPGTYDAYTGELVALPPLSQIDGLNQTTWTTDQGNHYGYLAGTSFAAPEVAGVAALVWAARPELTNYQVADILKQSAHREAADWTSEMGCGELDAGAALELATSRSADAWAQTPNTTGTVCTAFGEAPAPTGKSQTIVFAKPANKHLGDRDFKLKAQASSGLPVTFTVSGPCTMNGAAVHLTGTGWCNVIASQDGDAEFAAAVTVTQKFHIGKQVQHKRTRASHV